jgi:hypothetical protein
MRAPKKRLKIFGDSFRHCVPLYLFQNSKPGRFTYFGDSFRASGT